MPRRSTAPLIALLVVFALALSACVIESPGIDAVDLTAGGTTIETAPTEDPTATAVAAEPTPTPTPAPTPTPLPEPTATPAPTSTPVPAEPDYFAVPVIEPAFDLMPDIVEAGPIGLTVAGTTTLRLERDHPVLHVPGHALIYVDEMLDAEVDIFTPVAGVDGTPLTDMAAIEAYVLSTPNFSTVTPAPSVTIAGLATRVYDTVGTSDILRTIDTDPSTIEAEAGGWYSPPLARLWVIDAPNGPVVVSAESLFESRFADAVDLAASILASIEFDG